jgi:hypothetical protein
VDGGAPAQCMVLRGGGELSVLDLEAGGERAVAAGVDRFWLTMPVGGGGEFQGAYLKPRMHFKEPIGNP